MLEDFSPEKLIQAMEDNIIGSIEVWSRWPGFELHRDPNLTWTITDIPFFMFNGVLRTNATAETIDAVIDGVIDRGKIRKLPLAWWISPSAQPFDLGARLAAKGFVHLADLPGMAVDLALLNEDVPRPAGLTIDEVADVETLKTWTQVAGTANEFPDFVADALLQIYTTMGLGNNLPWKHFLARLDGKPVGVSALFFEAGVAGVHTVGTVPEARRQGIGAALTLAPLLTARREGYRIGALFSSDMGVNVYRALGFQEYCQGSLYLWMDQSDKTDP